jgi:hypothetical protein
VVQLESRAPAEMVVKRWIRGDRAARGCCEIPAVRMAMTAGAPESATERRHQARGKTADKRGLHVGAVDSQWATQIKGKLGRIGWFRPNRAQHPFSFIFSFSFLFSLIFESKFEFQICDELVLKFSEYMI